MARYQHVIWDWNGTLLDDVELCIDVMNGMLRARELPPVDIDRYREIFDFPVVGYYRTLGFDFSQESFEELASEYCDCYDRRVSDCDLHEGVVALLDRLAVTIPRQSILSSCQQNALDQALGCFGLGDRFAQVVGQSNHYASGKVDAGHALVSASRVALTRTVLIGDTLHDLEVAQALGVDCVLVAIGHHSRTRLEAVSGAVVDSLERVVERLT